MVLAAMLVRAEVPTISFGAVNGSSTLTDPQYYSLTNSFFTFPGVRPAQITFNGSSYFYPIGDTDPQGTMMPMKVAFSINAQAFEVLCFGGYPCVMVANPPDYTTFTNRLASAMGQGYTWVRVQFATKATRNIIFYLSGSQGNYIGGVNVQAGDTISTNTLGPRKTLEVLGDSYTEGYSQSDVTSRWLGGFSMQLERMLTNVDVIPAGVGGTGYSWPGVSGAGTTNYLGRFWTDVVSNNPNYLIINGGLNDANNNVPTNVLQNAVNKLFSLAVANLPQTKIAVVGNFFITSYYPPFSPASGNSRVTDAIIGQAATNYGLPFIDAIANNWLNSNNFTVYMGNDSIHPTIAGYGIIASNLLASLPPTFPNSGVIVSNNPVTATFTASPLSGSAPLPVNFAYTGNTGSSFSWSFGDGGTSTAANPVYSYNSAGTYTVSLTVNGSVTQVMTGMITVTNSSVPVSDPASASFTASSTVGGAPTLINFNYTGTNGSSFMWSFGDGGTSTLQNPSYTYSFPGNFSVQLVVNGSVTNEQPNLITITNTTSGTVSGGTLNVSSFGATGDAVQFYVNTVSNSTLVTTTNIVPNSAIGDGIEVFQAGVQTYGVNSYGTNAYGNQDLVAYITNIVNGTNLYLNIVASNTLDGAFATYGHDNSTNFQNALNAAGTNSIVSIPAGTYLFLTHATNNIHGYYSVLLNKGGITITGAGTNATRLIAQGAWQMQQNFPTRGILFEENPPINDNAPITIENMTLDGGVQQGNTQFHNYPANFVDGQGWDGTHGAFLVWSLNNANAFNQMTWTNLVFQHWRAEIVKSIDQSTNGNLLIEDCVFNDGNATAINLYASLDVTNCLFNNLFQVAEYYQAYNTNTSYFEDNIVTNLTGNAFALNGGKGNNPYFVFRNNQFDLEGWGNNGIETTPGDNIIISNNLFVCANWANAIVLGCAGYQGSFDNSNIVITANTVVNPYVFVEVAGGSTSADPNHVESVSITKNTLLIPNQNPYLLLDYGWSTNIVVSGNDCSLNTTVKVQPGPSPLPYAVVNTDNVYYTYLQSGTLTPNILSYGNGSRYYTSSSINGSSYVLQNSDASQIPAGAQVLFNNQNSFNVPLYLNSTSGPQLIVTNGTAVTVNWVNNQWVYPGVSSNGVPASPVIQVTPGSISFGTILAGTSITNNLIVSNVGGGTMTGSANVAAPFSLPSGGSYSLGPNQSQTISVVFTPTSATSYSQTVTLSGGNGANVVVSGTGTNAPTPSPSLLVTPGSLPFGTVLVGKSVTNNLVVANTGGGTLAGLASATAPFSILSGGTYSLGSNQSQTVSVVFTPTTAMSYSQNVAFTGGTGMSVVVSGNATNAPAPSPVLQVTPGSLAFGAVLVGKSITNSLVVANRGGGTLAGTANATAPFSILSGGTYSLGSNQSQTVSVVFTPPTATSYSQNVAFTGGTGTNVVVSGSATNAPAPSPALQATPGSLAFGTVLVGKSFTNSLVVANRGGGTLAGTASTTAPFSILSGGTYSLGSNQSQTVSVVFTPTAVASYSQNVTFSGGVGTNVAVYGSATNAPTAGSPVIKVTPGTLAFGKILSGTDRTNTLTVANIGSGTLSGSVSVAAPFSILSGGTYSLGSNQTQTVSFLFAPATSSTNNQIAVFTGGNGTNVTLTGTSTNYIGGVMPTVSAISASLSNLGSNPAVLAINPGPITLSATAWAFSTDKIAWQWLYKVNGGAQTIYALGTGASPSINFTNAVNCGGNTNVWTLEVIDTKSGLSAKSQLTTFIQLPSPQGMQISFGTQ